MSDGVAILRAAADLESRCSGRVCDMDGNGTITVSDGVAALRRAAQLAAGASCQTRFGELVKTVLANGVVADLHLGAPPTSTPGAPVDVLSIEGNSEVESGQSTSLTVRLQRSVDTLVVGFQENGNVVDGFVELPNLLLVKPFGSSFASIVTTPSTVGSH